MEAHENQTNQTKSRDLQSVWPETSIGREIIMKSKYNVSGLFDSRKKLDENSGKKILILKQFPVKFFNKEKSKLKNKK